MKHRCGGGAVLRLRIGFYLRDGGGDLGVQRAVFQHVASENQAHRHHDRRAHRDQQPGEQPQPGRKAGAELPGTGARAVKAYRQDRCTDRPKPGQQKKRRKRNAGEVETQGNAAGQQRIFDRQGPATLAGLLFRTQAAALGGRKTFGGFRILYGSGCGRGAFAVLPQLLRRLLLQFLGEKDLGSTAEAAKHKLPAIEGERVLAADAGSFSHFFEAIRAAPLRQSGRASCGALLAVVVILAGKPGREIQCDQSDVRGAIFSVYPDHVLVQLRACPQLQGVAFVQGVAVVAVAGQTLGCACRLTDGLFSAAEHNRAVAGHVLAVKGQHFVLRIAGQQLGRVHTQFEVAEAEIDVS